MRFLVLITLALSVSACSTAQKPKGYELPPALREVFRGGEIKGLENTGGDPYLYPSQTDLVQQVCVSQPIYGLYGEYIRTAVRCW